MTRQWLMLLVLACGCRAASPPVVRVDPRPPALELRFPVPRPAQCSRGWLPELRHFALDVVAADGTPVVASGPGVVVRASPHHDYGLIVVVHHSASGEDMYTVYAHLSAVAVSVGEAVDAGTKLGEVGRSGNATRPHLHWEVLRARYPLPLRPDGPLGIPGDTHRVDPATVANVPPSCRSSAGAAATGSSTMR